jgi:hypothetical protein
VYVDLELLLPEELLLLRLGVYDRVLLLLLLLLLRLLLLRLGVYDLELLFDELLLRLGV